MEKIKEKMLFGLVLPIAIVGGFLVSVLRVHAGEIAGTEGVFTHEHVDGCYESVTLNCTNHHTSFKAVEYGNYHCFNCQVQTKHTVVAKNWSCSVQGCKWQTEGSIDCTVCGTNHSTWTMNPPGSHTYKERRLKCLLQENESIAVVKIWGEDSWTNTGVNLTASVGILKEDLTNNGIALDWEGGKYFATENGTYTVTATNSVGKMVTSSIQITCIDKNTPVIESVVGDENGMSRKGITVSVKATDYESGLADAAFSLDGGVSWGTVASFYVEEGKMIQFAVRDKAGNVSNTTIKRSDFAYPPEPVVTPVPEANTSKPVPEANTSKPVPEVNTSKPVSTVPVENVTNPTEQVSNTSEQEAKKELEKQKAQEAKKEHERKRLLEREEARQHFLTMQEKARGEYFTKSRKIQTISYTQKTTVSEGDAERGVEVEENVMTPSDVRQSSSSLSLRSGLAYIVTILCSMTVVFLAYKIWLHSVVLYGYEGGDEYRKIGLFYLKQGKEELELYLPEYILQSTSAFRYRLMLRNRLVKKCGNQELVVYNEEGKLRQQVEECVDFVL